MKKHLIVALALALTSAPHAVAQSASAALRNGLPPAQMDSFVHEAGPFAEMIYGDEPQGDEDIPPYFQFTPEHRIGSGIIERRDEGLTTGHGAYLPSAWGADEFLYPPGEWANSGAGGNGAGITLVGPPGYDISSIQQISYQAQMQYAGSSQQLQKYARALISVLSLLAPMLSADQQMALQSLLASADQAFLDGDTAASRQFLDQLAGQLAQIVNTMPPGAVQEQLRSALAQATPPATGNVSQDAWLAAQKNSRQAAARAEGGQSPF